MKVEDLETDPPSFLSRTLLGEAFCTPRGAGTPLEGHSVRGLGGMKQDTRSGCHWLLPYPCSLASVTLGTLWKLAIRGLLARPCGPNRQWKIGLILCYVILKFFKIN